MDVKCVLQEKVSKNTGKQYYCLYVPIIQKTIFLEPVELELLQLKLKENKNEKVEVVK